MDWDKLRVFHAVASAGNFTKATKSLNISQSAISRQVNILEDELGIPLFKRVPRGLELTQAGATLKNTVTSVFARLAMAQASMEELKNSPYGPIKVATTISFGSFWLAPKLEEFLQQYPDIHIQLILKDEEIDFNMREADIGIMAFPGKNPDLIQTNPVSYPFRVYANSAYLEKYGTPQTVKDLDRHRLIVFGNEMPHVFKDLDWLLKIGTKKQRVPYLIINSAQAIYEAVKSGIGIACLPKYMVVDDHEIIEILPDISDTRINRYIVYPSHLENLKRIQVFVDFISKKMREDQL